VAHKKIPLCSSGTTYRIVRDVVAGYYSQAAPTIINKMNNTTINANPPWYA